MKTGPILALCMLLLHCGHEAVDESATIYGVNDPSIEHVPEKTFGRHVSQIIMAVTDDPNITNQIHGIPTD